jgi:hypothetical protein
MANGKLREAATPAAATVPCCPEIVQGPRCDVIDIRYAVPMRTAVRDRVVTVQLIFHWRLERCSEGLVQGDIAYTTTLLPGEQVRLFSSNRHTSWSFDSASTQSYRHETTSEESYLTWGIARAVSDLSISESASGSSSSSESWAEGGGSAGINLGIISIGGGGGGGSYDASSAFDFNRQLSQHAQAASSSVAAGVRAASTTRVGEVESRSHAEGESAERIESVSRTFSNHNRCHAVSYYFYHLMKKQRIRFRLVAIRRTVNDPAAPTVVDQRPPVAAAGGVSVKPQRVLATQKDRLEIERMARTASLEQQRSDAQFTVANVAVLRAGPAVAVIDPALREAALAQATKELAAAGMVDARTGEVADKVIAELSWEREELLPTPGLIVRGCLDECNTCEPALRRSIELDLLRKELENKMLEKQIALLEKSQEYRCCPAGEEEEED